MFALRRTLQSGLCHSRCVASVRALAVNKPPARRWLAADGHTGIDMPVPQSMKSVFAEGHATNEGWETTIAWFYPTSFLILVWIFAFEPETDIRTWARQEARARMAIKKENPDFKFEFGKHYQGMSDDELRSEWDNFSRKALNMVSVYR